LKKIVFKQEYTLAWKDLNPIRNSIETTMKSKNFAKKDTDSVIIVVNELMENICKYSEKKIAYILIYRSEEHVLTIRLEQPLTVHDLDNINELKEEVVRVNAYADTQQLIIDSLKRTIDEKHKSRIGLALIRNTTKGSTIDIRKSRTYHPGMVVIVRYPLSE
jgi:hypothetical protein